MADFILHAPQPHERRHENQDATARAQHAAHLAQTAHVVVKMLHDIQRRDQIKSAVLVRQIFRGAQPHVIKTARSTKIQSIF